MKNIPSATCHCNDRFITKSVLSCLLLSSKAALSQRVWAYTDPMGNPFLSVNIYATYPFKRNPSADWHQATLKLNGIAGIAIRDASPKHFLILMALLLGIHMTPPIPNPTSVDEERRFFGNLGSITRIFHRCLMTTNFWRFLVLLKWSQYLVVNTYR